MSRRLKRAVVFLENLNLNDTGGLTPSSADVETCTLSFVAVCQSELNPTVPIYHPLKFRLERRLQHPLT
jgi:hypothetical protein